MYGAALRGGKRKLLFAVHRPPDFAHDLRYRWPGAALHTLVRANVPVMRKVD